MRRLVLIPLLLTSLVLGAAGGPVAGASPAAATGVLVTVEGIGALDGVAGVRSARQLADQVFLVSTERPDVLRALPGVLAVEAVQEMAPLRVPSDAAYAQQWSHDLTGIEGLWDVQTGSRDVGVALLDTGVRGDHPDLIDNVVAQVNVSAGSPVDVKRGTNNDTCALGHGTQVAGVIGAAGDNGLDVAGVAWQVSIVDVAVAGVRSGCRMTDATLVAGLGWVAKRDDVDIVNLSFGRQASACPVAVQTAIDQVVAAGKLVIAAGGNARHSSTTVGTVPAACRKVLAVGPAAPSGTPASYGSAGPWLDLLGPGGEVDSGIVTLSESLGTITVSGSSLAAGYVSGVAALLKAAVRAATPAQLERALLGAATDVAPSGRDDRSGWGLVAPQASLAALQGNLPAARADVALPVANQGPVRTAGGNGIDQALAASKVTFGTDSARHAVLARVDDYADALAGSGLAAGWGPVLLTNRVGAVPAAVVAELQRILPPGGLVYILGGGAAVPGNTGAQLHASGLTPKRLAGDTREGTAALVADEVLARRAALGLPAPTSAVLATARNWPDAAVAASLVGAAGAPIVVTGPAELHPAAADALRKIRPTTLYVVGGPTAVGERAADAARRAAGVPANRMVRLSGNDRHGTAIRVATETEALLRAKTGMGPSLAAAVNLRRADGFAYLVSVAPLLAVLGGVYVPLEGQDGSGIDPAAARYACTVGGRVFIAGPTHVVSKAGETRFIALHERRDRACTS